MKKLTIEQTLLNMWQENTGIGLCDSGGTSGRAWQRNQNKTIEYFNNKPSGFIEYSYSEKHGLDIYATASMWHHLKACLELDDLCHVFNSREVHNWDSEEAYGLSLEGEDFLYDSGAEFDKPWNTYNWENNFDAVLQGCNLTIGGEDYVLIQYHGGADVRGGYTDAKLFKLGHWEKDYFLYSDTVYGEFFDELDDGFEVCSSEGVVSQSTGCNEISEEMRSLIIKKHKLSNKKSSLVIETGASEF